MPFSDEMIRKLTEPPSYELLRRVARELYEVEPLVQPGNYGSGETVVERDSPMRNDAAREWCAHDAATIIASWQRAVMDQAGR